MDPARRSFLLGMNRQPLFAAAPGRPVGGMKEIQVLIKSTCLATRQVVCRSCGESCGRGAIFFHPARGGISLPQFDVVRCDGCGACLTDCPVGAISLRREAGEATL